MAVDHLLFDSLKWFNINNDSTEISANNKAFLAMPTEITVPDGFRVNLDSSMYEYNDEDGFCLKDDHTAEVVAVGEDDYIVHPQQSWNSDTYRDNSEDGRSHGYNKYIAWLKVPKTQAKNVKWGGKALLSHVYQWFRSLYRMVVIAC
ncbi:hypothetical protein [Lactobacillus helveticus]|uniref:hypothetical protein n=1 Tax=Lactobacillus helveticus TaxID=1587 RepID=UPI00062AB88A|nr:hypothetical protein [Lactobacillus helveticus]AKG66929.1 hypothetical protein TU99_06605 [Lactobacillus helveticus]